MTMELSKEENKVLDILNKAHDNNRICLTLPEICSRTRYNRTKVKLILKDLKGIVCEEKHSNRYLYYIKKRISIKKRNQKKNNK